MKSCRPSPFLVFLSLTHTEPPSLVSDLFSDFPTSADLILLSGTLTMTMVWENALAWTEVLCRPAGLIRRFNSWPAEELQEESMNLESLPQTSLKPELSCKPEDPSRKSAVSFWTETRGVHQQQGTFSSWNQKECWVTVGWQMVAQRSAEPTWTCHPADLWPLCNQLKTSLILTGSLNNTLTLVLWVRLRADLHPGLYRVGVRTNSKWNTGLTLESLRWRRTVATFNI